MWHHLQAVHNGLPLLEHAGHAGQQVMPRCKHCLLLLLCQAHGSLHRLILFISLRRVLVKGGSAGGGLCLYGVPTRCSGEGTCAKKGPDMPEVDVTSDCAGQARLQSGAPGQFSSAPDLDAFSETRPASPALF